METFLAAAAEQPALFASVTFFVGTFALLALKAAMSPKPRSAPKLSPDEFVPYRAGEPTWVVDPKAEAPVRVAKAGIASIKPMTLNELFAAAADNMADKPALKCERGGKWQTWTWGEYYAECEKVGKALISLGLGAGDCVNVIGFNSPEWFMAQMGAILMGGKAAGVYTTNEPDACKYVAEHSEARVVFLEDVKQLNKYMTFYEELDQLRALCVWGEEIPASCRQKTRSSSSIKVMMSWAEMLESGESTPKATLAARGAAVKPGHCASLIYTSGTTGNPKAVMISHDNLVYQSISACDSLFCSGRLSASATLPKELRIVSYLPLSHIAAQMVDLATPIILTGLTPGVGPSAFAPIWYTTWFARPDAMKGTLKNTLVACRPTAFLGVPRVWEKIRESLLEIGRKNTGLKKKLSDWAKRQAAFVAKERQLGGSGTQTVSYLIAKKLLSKVKDALGLDQCIVCATAAAPMPREVSEYFASLDIDLLDVYGMSESTGATTCSTEATHHFGTVGPAIGSNELKIDHVAGRDKPSEGEICYRGRHIMMGYMKEPAKTAETIDPDGWLHSGDVGLLDADGLLHITGRIKELIITAGGENIAPVPIEDKLKELCPAISNVMMVGDKRKYNVCIITLKTVMDPETATSTGVLAGDAARVSAETTTDAAAIAQSKVKGSTWQKYLQGGIDELNAKHSVSNAQKLQKFTVVPGDFSEKGGELTATLKLKRSVAAEIHKDAIEAMY